MAGHWSVRKWQAQAKPEKWMDCWSGQEGVLTWSHCWNEDGREWIFKVTDQLTHRRAPGVLPSHGVLAGLRGSLCSSQTRSPGVVVTWLRSGTFLRTHLSWYKHGALYRYLQSVQLYSCHSARKWVKEVIVTHVRPLRCKLGILRFSESRVRTEAALQYGQIPTKSCGLDPLPKRLAKNLDTPAPGYLYYWHGSWTALPLSLSLLLSLSTAYIPDSMK